MYSLLPAYYIDYHICCSILRYIYSMDPEVQRASTHIGTIGGEQVAEPLDLLAKGIQEQVSYIVMQIYRMNLVMTILRSLQDLLVK